MQPEVLVNVAQLSSARRRTIICMVHLGQFRFFCICGLYHKHLLQFSMIYASRLSNLYVQQRFEGIFVISQDVYFSSQTSELEGLKTCLLRTGPLFSMNFILELIFSLSYLGHLLYHLITCAAIAMDFVFPGSMVAYSQVLYLQWIVVFPMCWYSQYPFPMCMDAFSLLNCSNHCLLHFCSLTS